MDRRSALFDKSFQNNTKAHFALDLHANIIADAVDFGYVNVEFSDEIKTENNNFFTAFCTHLIDAIDYFLGIFFTHRNGMIKSDNVAANPAKTKSAKELATQPKSTLTMPSTSTTSQSTQSPQNTFHLKPSEQILSIIREMLSRSVNFTDDNAAVQQYRAETVIESVIQILRREIYFNCDFLT